MKDRLAATAPARVVRRYLDAEGGTWAVVVAWNLLFAFFPIVLVAVTVLGLVMRGQGVAGSIESQIQHAFPGGDGRSVVDALRAFRASAGPLAVVSFVGLMWSGSALFGAVEQALDALQPCPRRGFVRQRLMAFSMILVFTVLIIIAVASSSLLSVVGRLPDVPTWLTTGPFGVLLQIAAGLLDGLLLFAVVYRLVPNRTQRLRAVMPGALTAAVLFEAYTLLFPLYFRLEHGFSTYGSTFALFFLLLTYAYFMAQILVFGGAVNAELHPPAPHAHPDPAVAGPGGAAASAVDIRGETAARQERAASG